MIRRTRRDIQTGLLLTAACLPILAGCATQRYATASEQLLPEIDIIQLRDDASRALEESQRLRARVDSLQLRLLELEKRGAAVRASASAQAPAVTVSPPAAQPVSPAPAARPSAGIPPSAPQQDRPVSDAALYQEGIDAFNARDYARSAERFLQVIAVDQRGSYAQNACYWLGECRYAQGDYEAALKQFAEVLLPPASSKDDDAQLKLGLCCLKLGRTGEARAAFETLLRDYPQSEYADRARGYLERLRSE